MIKYVVQINLWAMIVKLYHLFGYSVLAHQSSVISEQKNPDLNQLM